MEEVKTPDSQYIQQHLANERTFLAWVRTGIAVIGLGFLATGVVFRSNVFRDLGHWIAAVVGIGAVFLGAVIMFCATRDYFRKQRGINESAFRSPHLSIWVIFSTLGLIDILLLVLVIALLLY